MSFEEALFSIFNKYVNTVQVLALCLLSEGQRLYLHWSHKVNHTVHKHKHCHTALSFCASTCYTLCFHFSPVFFVRLASW